MRWKLSVDATPAPGLERVYGSNSDTLSALIVFSCFKVTTDAF